MTLYAKMAMLSSQPYPLNLYLINNVEDNVAFLGLNVVRQLKTAQGGCLPSTLCTYLSEFKEFEPRLKFKPQLKFGWFYLKL